MLLTRRTALIVLTAASLSLPTPSALAGVVKVKRKPADLDYSLSRVSETRGYSATVKPELSPVKTGKLHSWRMDLVDTDGQPVAAWERMSETERGRVNRVFANTGKAIAAFERTLAPQPTRFDTYADAVAAGQASPALSATEAAGLKLFIGKGNCINCHNGPRLTDDHFHNTGVPARGDLPPDSGRSLGATEVSRDPFNCLGRYSDAESKDCGELTFMQATGEGLVRAYKTPSLRGVRQRAPYMHAGQYAALDDVIIHYNRAPSAPAGHSEVHRLHLTARERQALAAFLGALDNE